MNYLACFLLTIGCYALAGEPEYWLVELEYNDGIYLHFHGAQLELGHASLQGVTHYDELIPGMALQIYTQHGVANAISLDSLSSVPAIDWRRGEDYVEQVIGDTLWLPRLGVQTFDEKTRWHNGSVADLQPGRRLVLSRDHRGRLTHIVVVNPEDESGR